jgi:hypothetical protein
VNIKWAIPVERFLQTKFSFYCSGNTKMMNEKVEEVGVLRPEVQGLYLS